MKWIVAAILALCLSSCANNANNKHSEVGKYVYVDCFNVIHTDRNCPLDMATNAKTKDERLAARRGVEFIDTCSLIQNPQWPYKYCPKCVDDAAYKHLIKIFGRNKYPHVSEIDWSTD